MKYKYIIEPVGDGWNDCETCGGTPQEFELVQYNTGLIDFTLTVGCYGGQSDIDIHPDDLNDDLDTLASLWFRLPEVVDAITAARTRALLDDWDNNDEDN